MSAICRADSLTAPRNDTFDSLEEMMNMFETSDLMGSMRSRRVRVVHLPRVGVRDVLRPCQRL